jgi:hypothetical protein
MKTRPKPDGNAQPLPMPPPGQRAVFCRCGARYLDNPPGRDAHNTVFGHTPAPREQAQQ